MLLRRHVLRHAGRDLPRENPSHCLSHWYSKVNHSLSVLVHTEIVTLTTVSVSATDEAHASQLLDLYTATALLPGSTETHVHVKTSVTSYSSGHALESAKSANSAHAAGGC